MINATLHFICDACRESIGFKTLSLSREALEQFRATYPGWTEDRDNPEKHYCPQCSFLIPKQKSLTIPPLWR